MMTNYTIALAVLPKFSGTLSFIGSTYILQDVVRSIISEKKSGNRQNRHFRRTGAFKNERIGIHHRLVLGLSLCDLLASIVNIVGTWAIPKLYYENVYMSSGSIGTCSAMGFINELGNLGAPIYNTSLCIHYMLVIVYGMSEEKILKKGIEFYLHFTPWIFGSVFAILGLVLKQYHGAGSWCWFAEYPPGCSTESIDPDTNLPPLKPCIRGHYKDFFRMAHLGIAWFCLVVCGVALFSIYNKVMKQEKSVAKYRYSRSLENYSNDRKHITNSSHQHHTCNIADSNNVQLTNINDTNSRNNNDTITDDNHKDTDLDSHRVDQVQLYSIDADVSFTENDHTENDHTMSNTMSTEFYSNNHNTKNNVKAKMNDSIGSITTNDNNSFKEKYRNLERTKHNISRFIPNISAISDSNVIKNNKNKNRNKKKSRQIVEQATLFMFVMVLTWIFPTIIRFSQFLGKKPPSWLMICFVIFFPLQGFGNALVYLRPKVINNMKNKRRRKRQEEIAAETKREQIKEKITKIFYVDPKGQN